MARGLLAALQQGWKPLGKPRRGAPKLCALASCGLGHNPLAARRRFCFVDEPKGHPCSRSCLLVLEIRMGGVFRRWARGSWFAAGAFALLLAGCDNSPWESGAADQNTLFTAMQEGS